VSTDLRDFERLAAALRPWLGSVVIIGGWAHRLHFDHALAGKPGFQPVRTRDADVAFAANAKLRGNIAQALKTAKFTEDLSTDETPPVAQYVLGDSEQGFYAEFLTPLTGSGVRRDGREDVTVARAGITAQKLRHLEVLMVAPWTLRIGGASEVLPEPVEVRVVNPAAFLAQKLLIHGARKPDKQAQDILYIHDTLQLFGAQWAMIAALWRDQVQLSLTAKQRATVQEAQARVFGRTTDVIRAAARIPVDRTLRPEDVRMICARGLATTLPDQ
jgi:hypothetical protein